MASVSYEKFDTARCPKLIHATEASGPTVPGEVNSLCNQRYGMPGLLYGQQGYEYQFCVAETSTSEGTESACGMAREMSLMCIGM